MRIGIISDIHGDIETLNKTITKLYNDHHVSVILSAGDLIGRGPEQNQVVEVHRQHDIITVRGNHDECFNGITKENAAFLKALPIDWRGKIGGRRFFMCHGKPGNNMWGMYRNHLSDTYLNMVLKSLQAEVLVTGHTHVPLYVRVESGCVLNPGSLYAFDSTRATSHTYGVLDLDDLSFDVFDSRVGETAVPLSWKAS